MHPLMGDHVGRRLFDYLWPPSITTALYLATFWPIYLQGLRSCSVLSQVAAVVNAMAWAAAVGMTMAGLRITATAAAPCNVDDSLHTEFCGQGEK